MFTIQLLVFILRPRLPLWGLHWACMSSATAAYSECCWFLAGAVVYGVCVHHLSAWTSPHLTYLAAPSTGFPSSCAIDYQGLAACRLHTQQNQPLVTKVNIMPLASWKNYLIGKSSIMSCYNKSQEIPPNWRDFTTANMLLLVFSFIWFLVNYSPSSKVQR